jgi:phage terminase large subunit-like protein
MKLEDGIGYAAAVAKGEINACRNVRLACQRFLNHLENKEWEYVFDPGAVNHFLQFTSLCRHVKGQWAGQPVNLEPFQILIICAIYGFRLKRDRSKRMVQDVIVYIPRKAGKSTLTALIALYELAFGDAGAEVYTVATNRDQASIVFTTAKGFIETLPREVSGLFIPGKFTIVKNGDSQSVFKALSRDTKRTGDGLNPSCAIIDEASQIIDRNTIEVLHSGMVARANPLRLYITTASFTRDTKFFEDLQVMEHILHQDVPDNPRWFGLLYSLDAGDDWRDPTVWHKANPMHNISVSHDAISARCEEAKIKPAALNEFLCKTLNVYVSAETAWVDRSHWDEAVGLTDREPEAVFIGFDLAATRDLNAVCTLKRYAEDDYEAEWKFFLPEDGFDLLPAHYQDIFRQAINSGILHITEGNVMDDREISEYILGQSQKYDVREVGYDAYNAAALVARLYEAGMPTKKVGQGMAVLSNPSKHVERLILGHKIKHDGNPFLGHQLGNCEVFVDVQGNIKVKKAGVDRHAKVDGIVALIIAMHCSLDNPMPSESYGFRVF